MYKLISPHAKLLSRRRVDSLDGYLRLFVGAWLLYLTAHALFINPVFHYYVSMKIADGVVLREVAFKSVAMFLTLAAPALIYFSNPSVWAERLCGIALAALAAYVCYLGISGIENFQHSETFFQRGGELFKHTGPAAYFNGISGTLIDKNNTACLMVAGLLYCLKNKNYLPLTLLFLCALVLTNSKAGMIAALVGTAYTIRPYFALGFIPLSPLLWFSESFHTRFPIWASTWEIIKDNPWGTGLGTFAAAYAKARTEQSTAGIFAHNDLLQFASELGWVAPVIFMGIILFAMRTVDRPRQAIILAISLMALCEFQFYVPAVAILFGLAIVHDTRRHSRGHSNQGLG